MDKVVQFIKYLFSGGSAVLVHLLVLWVGVEFLDIPHVFSSFIGFCVGTAVNYCLQHAFVFKKTGDHLFYFKKYLIVTVLMQGVNVSLFWLLLSYTNIQYIIAQILTIGVIFICNYIINAKYTFKDQST